MSFASSLPPWPKLRLPSACALAFVVGSGADLVLDRGPFPLHFVVCLAVLSIALGVLYGFLWQLAFWFASALPRRAAFAVWPVALSAVAYRGAVLLGAIKRLHGHYGKLAVLVLVGSALAAFIASALLLALQPFGKQGESYLASRRPRLRIAVALLLLITAAGQVYADRTLYVDLYPLAHFGLRMGALFAATFALAIVPEILPRASRFDLVLLAPLVAYVLVTLDDGAQRTIQAFFEHSWSSTVLTASRDVLDFDRDGYSSLLGGGDCAPWNPRVHPGAREIPDNGIDDNCAMGDGHRKVQGTAAVPMARKPSPLDVVLITVDSLRRDRVGVYPSTTRGSRALTPELDAWARRGTVFERAYSPGAWTTVAVPSIMRGVYARRLHWVRFYQTNSGRLVRGPLSKTLRPGESPSWLFTFPADDKHLPLAGWLSRRGMTTVAVVDDGPGEMLRPGTGLDEGFSRYVEVNPGAQQTRDDAGTSSEAIAALAQLPTDHRFFMWVHYFGVHSPNEFHLGTTYFGPTVPDGYDHEVRYADHELARLLAALDRREPKPAVFVTADHGEEITRTNRHHGYSLAEDLIAVPLIAHVPGWPVGEVDTLTNLVDLVPTILALTETPAPSDLDGWDLARHLTPAEPARILISDTWRFDVGDHLAADYVAAFDGRRKVVIDELGQGISQYDQTRPKQRPSPLPNARLDPLARVALGYLEDTGGMPAPGD